MLEDDINAYDALIKAADEARARHQYAREHILREAAEDIAYSINEQIRGLAGWPDQRA